MTEKRLRVGIARDNFMDLPRWSAGWQGDEQSYYRAVAAAGYEGVMGVEPGPWREHGLQLFGHGVVLKPGDAEPYARMWAERGATAASCIAGTGMESDADADELVEAILRAGKNAGLPLYAETHRTSITQDPWRCLRLSQRHPELSFNCDFSHWYTGLDLRALDFDAWLEQMRPMLARVRMLHGRIGDRGCVQVAFAQAGEAMPFHRRVWGAVMEASVRESDGMEDLWVFPELLGSYYGYVRRFGDEEETDRWLDAGLIASALVESAKECGMGTPSPRVLFGLKSAAD